MPVCVFTCGGTRHLPSSFSTVFTEAGALAEPGAQQFSYSTYLAFPGDALPLSSVWWDSKASLPNLASPHVGFRDWNGSPHTFVTQTLYPWSHFPSP